MSKVLDEITKIITDDKVIGKGYKVISIRTIIEGSHYADVYFFITMKNEKNSHITSIVFEQDEFNNMIKGLSYSAWFHSRMFGERIDVNK